MADDSNHDPQGHDNRVRGGHHDGEARGDHEHPKPIPPPLAPDDPGPRALEDLEPEAAAAFLSDTPARVVLEPGDNPAPEASFGFVDRFVRLSGDDEELVQGTLVIALEQHHADEVARETLRAFRWSEQLRGFELVENSGLGGSRDYVWARVSEPGLYALIGVSTDPLVARTLAIMASLDDLTALDGLGGREFLGGRICELILCLPYFRDRMADPEFVRAVVESNLRLGLPARWGPAGLPNYGSGSLEGVCEKCLGLGLDRPRVPGKLAWPPEIELLPKVCVHRPLEVGRWDVLPVVPSAANTVLAVHAALLPNGKIVYFGGDENVLSQNQAGGAAIDNTRVFDPQAGTITTVGSPPNYDLFCCGHALLPDGRLLAAGGTKQFPIAGGHPYHGGHFEGVRNSAIFDAAAPSGANPWTATAPLNRERNRSAGGGAWYPTLVTLPNGRVLRVAGHPELGDTRHNNLMLESFDSASGTWIDEGAGADLPTTPVFDGPLYPRLHVLPDGHLFSATPLEPPAGPSGDSWKWNLTTKAWTSIGSGPGVAYGAFDVSSVLLPLLPAHGYRARVLMTNKQQAQIIDLDASSPTWQPTGARSLSDPATGLPTVRYHATAVLLPDASVLVIGGYSDPNNWSPPVLAAERFDPATGSWSTMATAVVPRVYHSVALLLPDGRVWTAGSDYGYGNHEPRMEVYSPPYLFKGPRPTITGAPAALAVGGTFTISCPEAPRIRTVCLLRCGSSTHAFNPDQRYVELVIQTQTSTQLTMASPPNRNVAPPGYYLLFVLDNQGVPSVGSIVRLQ